MSSFQTPSNNVQVTSGILLNYDSKKIIWVFKLDTHDKYN